MGGMCCHADPPDDGEPRDGEHQDGIAVVQHVLSQQAIAKRPTQ